MWEDPHPPPPGTRGLPLSPGHLGHADGGVLRQVHVGGLRAQGPPCDHGGGKQRPCRALLRKYCSWGVDGHFVAMRIELTDAITPWKNKQMQKGPQPKRPPAQKRDFPARWMPASCAAPIKPLFLGDTGDTAGKETKDTHQGCVGPADKTGCRRRGGRQGCPPGWGSG